MKKNSLWSLMVMLLVIMISVALTSCGGDDDSSSMGNKDLVGTWTQPYGTLGVIGIKLTADGRAYYNEWSKGKNPNFDNVKSPAYVKVTATTIRITHPSNPDYYEEYSYILSSDKKSVIFTLISWNEDKHSLNGTFTKVE